MFAEHSEIPPGYAAAWHVVRKQGVYCAAAGYSETFSGGRKEKAAGALQSAQFDTEHMPTRRC